MCSTITSVPSTMMPKSNAPRLSRFAGVLSPAHQHDAFDSIRFTVNPKNAGGRTGADLDAPDIPDKYRHALGFSDNDIFDVIGSLQEPDATDNHSLLPVV